MNAHQSQNIAMMKYMTRVLIYQYPFAVQYEQIKEKEAKIKSFLFLGNKGKAYLKTTLLKSVVAFNEDLVLFIDVDNSQCKTDINRVEVKLSIHVRLKGGRLGNQIFHQNVQLDKRVYYTGADSYSYGDKNEEFKNITTSERITRKAVIPLYNVDEKALLSLKPKDKELYFAKTLQPTSISEKTSIFYTVKAKVFYRNMGSHSLE